MPLLSNCSLKLPVDIANITVDYCLPGKCFPACFTGCFGCVEIVRSPLSFDRLDPEMQYSPHFTGLGDTWETWSAALNTWSTPPHKRLDLSCFADCRDYCWERQFHATATAGFCFFFSSFLNDFCNATQPAWTCTSSYRKLYFHIQKMKNLPMFTLATCNPTAVSEGNVAISGHWDGDDCTSFIEIPALFTWAWRSNN